ncbi:MAG: hypothetical protein NTX22_12490 [Ignavibacteriales bacterium]|nr:hypothetical protein [Ignavibacteriales bacterium]
MKQADIDALIIMPKLISSSTKGKFKLINRSRRINLEAISEDEKNSFEIFIRQSEKFEERFSIGLMLIPPEEDNIILVRYNGVHGEHKNLFTDRKVYYSFHKHYATEEAILQEIKPEHTAKESNYVHFKGALIKFFEELNFINYKDYLKIFEIEYEDPDQTNLFGIQ